MGKAAKQVKDGPPQPSGRGADASAGGDPTTGEQAALEPKALREVAETFSMLASPTRLHLLWLLSRREYDVGSLADAVDASDAVVSQHLGKLRLADLVSARRQGKRQVYVVDDNHVITLIEQALDHHSRKRH
jgi:DNA-binding transcriptional ArsR family regulator